jgi:prepilin-type N-terminal cleavage/methylation domain-containing protein
VSRRAFTVVELLVSIAVIALLISLLLPALGAAREQARRVQCAGNLRSLAAAFEAYCHDNRGKFPGVASIPQLEWDWIYWAPTQGEPFNDFARGPLIRYLSSADPRLFRCPSDDWSAHVGAAGREPYRYSYAVNAFVANVPLNCCSATGRTCVRVRNASDKVLLTEPDERTIHCGMWLPGAGASASLSARHDSRNIAPGQFRTNVAFLDTHVDFVPWKLAADPSHFLGGGDDGSATLNIPDYFVR